MKTAEEMIIEMFEKGSAFYNEKDIKATMVEFAKMHVLKTKHLQQTKYYAGETGYIKSEEWEDIINNIK